MLNVIDVFSKFAWSVPLKDKKGDTVTEAFKLIVKESKSIPKHLWVDQGKEFYNKNMNEWLKENNINMYSTFGDHKSAVVERFNRTIKEKMWVRFTAENTRNWIEMLDRLMKGYNNTFHTTIGMSPINARKKINYELALQNTLDKTNNISKKKAQFKIDDKVRISRIKGLFEKGYLPNWSEEVFTIHKVKNTVPNTYILSDSSGEILEGGFYENELQKTNQELYRIEKVLQRKKIDGVEYALVKWSGYDKKHNQWIPVENFENIKMT